MTNVPFVSFGSLDFTRHQMSYIATSTRGVYEKKSKRYTQEFKIEAVKQITERGYSM